MALSRGIRNAARSLGQLRLLRQAGALYYERQFRGWPGAFRGVFETFAEARASSPSGARVGYDFDELAGLYQERLFRVYPADYPVLFWLGRVISQTRHVFDVGGHVGIAYYAFSRYLDYPPALRWTVQEVPSVASAGRKLALARAASALQFTSELSASADCDVLHSAGAMQYIETPLAQLLVEHGARPWHILLNKLPLHDGPSYVTLQNTLHSYNPYRVFNRAQLIASLEALEYRLVDSWENLELSCRVPFHPECDVPAYSGLYFRLARE